MTEPAYVAETLAWCNLRRAEQGKRPLKKLPKGERRNALSCPCGAAIGLRVGQYAYFTATKRPSTSTCLGELPPAVTRFVIAFDAGRLPQYEATR
jgi:hypothetical protein